jgi:hypothetical protein
MLHSNEVIALAHQAEALRQAKQIRLAREAQSKSNGVHLSVRLAAASRGLLTILARRGNYSNTTATLNTRHAR